MSSPGFVTVQPQTGLGPLGGYIRQLPVYPCCMWEVTMHQVTHHFPLLHSA
jgi:hypothetical protein